MIMMRTTAMTYHHVAADATVEQLATLLVWRNNDVC